MSLRKLGRPKNIGVLIVFLTIVLPVSQAQFGGAVYNQSQAYFVGPMPAAEDGAGVSEQGEFQPYSESPKVLSLSNYKEVLKNINRNDKVYAKAERLMSLYQERSLKICAEESIDLLPKAQSHSAYVFVFYIGAKCLMRLAVSDESQPVFGLWLDYILDHESSTHTEQFLDSEKQLIKKTLSEVRESLFRKSDELGLDGLQTAALARRVWNTDETLIAMKLFEFYMEKNDRDSAAEVIKNFDPDLKNLKILKKVYERQPAEIYKLKIKTLEEAKEEYKLMRRHYRARKYSAVLKSFKKTDFKSSKYYKKASQVLSWAYVKADEDLQKKILDDFGQIDVDFEVFAWILSNRGIHKEVFQAYEQVSHKTSIHHQMALRALLYAGDYEKAVQVSHGLGLVSKVKSALKSKPRSPKVLSELLGEGLDSDVLYWMALNYIRAEKYKAVLPLLVALEGSDTDYKLQAMYFQHRILKHELKSSSYKSVAKRIIKEYPLTFYGILVAHEEGLSNRLPFLKNKEAIYVHMNLNDDKVKSISQISFILNQGLKPHLRKFLEKTLEGLSLHGQVILAQHFKDIDEPLAAIKLMNNVWTKDHSLIRQDLVSIAYPTEILEKVKAQKEGDLEPNLILSVIRQESAFQERALSPSYARGLMQLLTPTAKEMARYLRMRRIRFPSALYNPDINIKLGSYYLHRLSRSYGQHLPLAFASYNAGPGRLSKWSNSRDIITQAKENLHSNDWKEQDLWVEEMPWSETRFYVKALLRNYALYSLFESFQAFESCYRVWNCKEDQTKSRETADSASL